MRVTITLPLRGRVGVGVGVGVGLDGLFGLRYLPRIRSGFHPAISGTEIQLFHTFKVIIIGGQT